MSLVYVYLDPRKSGKYCYGNYTFDFEPFYVGKGIPGRQYAHLKIFNQEKLSHKQSKINKLLKLNTPPIIIIISDNLTDVDAINLECELIKLIGRYDLGFGPLNNLTNGGDGYTNPLFSEDAIENRLKGSKQAFINRWFNNSEGKTEYYRQMAFKSAGNLGNFHTQETKEIIREKLINKWNESEFRDSQNLIRNSKEYQFKRIQTRCKNLLKEVIKTKSILNELNWKSCMYPSAPKYSDLFKYLSTDEINKILFDEGSETIIRPLEY